MLLQSNVFWIDSRTLIWPFFPDPTAILRGEHPGQAGREHPRDVGHGQGRVRLGVGRAQGRRYGHTSLSYTVPKSATGAHSIYVLTSFSTNLMRHFIIDFSYLFS